MNINGVIFDMDGVIFDTERIYLQVWTEVFKKYGHEMTKDFYLPLMGQGTENIKRILFNKYGDKLPIEKMYKEKDEKLMNIVRNGLVPLKDGAEDVLKYLKNKGYKIALATSARQERLQLQLTEDNVKKYFDAIVCSNDVKNAKPAPDIFLKAAENIDVEPSNCIVIEDSSSGIKAAYNASMVSFHVEDLKEADEEIKKYSDKQLKNIREIMNYL